MSDWCILRTKSRDTLKLAQSLGKAGIMAWTPIERIQIAKGKPKVEVPVLPTWVFAQTDLMDLIDLSTKPNSGHSQFSVFQFNGRYRLVRDSELRSLRLYVARKQEARDRRKLGKGTEVTIEDGAWAGLPGVIEKDNGRTAFVCFGRFSVEVESVSVTPFSKAA